MASRFDLGSLTARARVCALAGALLATAALAGCGSATSKDGSAAATSTSTAPAAKPVVRAEVKIASFKFLPQTVTVKAGGTVKFTNLDVAPHTATADGGAFDTDRLVNQKSATETFEKPGTYTYYCVYHRFMVGTVVVK
jgi:plastocyanin